MPTKPLTSTNSAFAPTFYLFQANAAALGVRIRRPDDFCHTEGSATLMGIGGCASASGKDVSFYHGVLAARQYSTLVTGDFANLKKAAALTDSHDGKRARWEENTLEAFTTSECSIDGFVSRNFDSPARTGGPVLEIDHLSFKMEGRHKRGAAKHEVRFKELAFDGVRINGRALKVSVDRKPFDQFPSFDALAAEYKNNAQYRAKLAGRVFAPATARGNALHAARGFATVTVVNKIEWADPKNADPNIVICGHSIYVPGYGKIYLGEMTISPYMRRVNMVRSELGCPEGGSSGGGLGCPGGYEHP